ncbi:hypothetical protein [Streptomyces candidus]|uniref:Uncharacterized protein n=1 Tax=Streptomyces candidus TaxID=67283 RepID=A0A7X0HGG8_9ACTN|nr:hypothetical protein [Streptomyces candidus]MBB6437195.1 hypothetical protein [Streptomyces candidus]GHH38171.1 hypothetical protein GCM10018773_15720 [Streptomyces candidus]
MKGVAPVVGAYERLVLGTGLLLHGAGDWLAPADSGTRFLTRTGGVAGGVLFAGLLLERAPHLVFVAPVAWAVAAWRVSESSATPPPLPETPSGDVFADGPERLSHVEWSPEGVRCTLHVVRDEVNGP